MAHSAASTRAPTTLIHADFTQRVLLHTEAMPWLDSPMAGVQRRMLDRVGDEVARATSIVRYAPGSAFAAHTHGGGEEFLVLQGVFQDEHGDHPAGSYVRNPPTTRHTPGSQLGCIIFVKLWQFDAADRTPVHIDTHRQAFAAAADRPGVSVLPLFDDSRESVRIERWATDADIEMALPGGAEVLVLDGALSEAQDVLTIHSWLRLPCGSTLRARAHATGARVWIKTGHLAHIV